MPDPRRKQSVPASPEVLIQVIVQTASAGIYGYVGRLVLHRNPPGDAARANHAFATWWFTLGLVAALNAMLQLSALVDLDEPALLETLLNAMLVTLAVGLCALTYYLSYVYTGRRNLIWPLGIAYALVALVFLYTSAWLEPTGTRIRPMGATLTYERDLTGWPLALFGALVAGPVLLASLAYASLYFRIHDPAPRFRIAMVAGSFLTWFGWSLLSTLLGLNQRFPDSLALLLTNHLMGLAVPLLTILAYRPPRRLRERWQRQGYAS